MIKHTLQQLSVDSIVPSKDNARHIDQKSESFKELVNSIEAGGVQIPIHVWPKPTRKEKFEIRCGERRWRACKSLGHKTIPAIVHQGISYDTAMMLTITENKFHEKLTPLEEVEEIARCMDHLDSDAKLISGLIGQTEQWVRLRANIHRNLVQEWRQVFLDQGLPRLRYWIFKTWSIGHLTLVARLPANSQKELLAQIKFHPWQWENISVQDLDKRIGKALQLLTKAKWNLDDDTLLPKAGSCSKCTKRSGAEPVLWFGAMGNQISSKDRCLDPQCWKSKMQSYLQQQAKQLSEKHSNLAYIATEHLSSEEKEELSKKFGRVLDQHDVQKSSKGAKGSIPALVVRGDGAGTVTFIREKQFARPAGARRAAGKPTPLKQRRLLLNAKRWSQVLIELRDKVEKAGIDQVVCKDKTTAVMALVVVYGNEPEWGTNIPTCQKEIERLCDHKRKNPTAAYSEALISLWNSFKPTLDRILTSSELVTQTSQFVIDNAKWIAKLIQVDIDKIFKEVSQQKGFTEPKSWKGLNADGTPRVSAKARAVAGKAAKKAKNKKPAATAT